MSDYRKLILVVGGAAVCVLPNHWIGLLSGDVEQRDAVLTAPEATQAFMLASKKTSKHVVEPVSKPVTRSLTKDQRTVLLKALMGPEKSTRAKFFEQKTVGQPGNVQMKTYPDLGEKYDFIGHNPDSNTSGSDYNHLKFCVLIKTIGRRIPGYTQYNEPVTTDTYLGSLYNYFNSPEFAPDWNNCRMTVGDTLKYSESLWERPELCSTYGNMLVGSKRISVVALLRGDVPEDHEYPKSMIIYCTVKGGTTIWEIVHTKQDFKEALDNLAINETLVREVPTDKYTPVILQNGARLTDRIGRVTCHVPGKTFTMDTGFVSGSSRRASGSGTWKDVQVAPSHLQKPTYLDPVDYAKGHSDTVFPEARRFGGMSDLGLIESKQDWSEFPGYHYNREHAENWNADVIRNLSSDDIETKMMNYKDLLKLTFGAFHTDTSPLFETKIQCSGKEFCFVKVKASGTNSVGLYVKTLTGIKPWAILHDPEDLARTIRDIIHHDTHYQDPIKPYSLTNTMGDVTLWGPWGPSPLFKRTPDPPAAAARA